MAPRERRIKKKTKHIILRCSGKKANIKIRCELKVFGFLVRLVMYTLSNHTKTWLQNEAAAERFNKNDCIYINIRFGIGKILIEFPSSNFTKSMIKQHRHTTRCLYSWTHNENPVCSNQYESRSFSLGFEKNLKQRNTSWFLFIMRNRRASLSPPSLSLLCMCTVSACKLYYRIDAISVLLSIWLVHFDFEWV